jgi:mRNA interferase MazF
MAELVRGDIWWADLPEPHGSAPGYKRPVLIIQADRFNRSRLQTVLVAVITTNLGRAHSPGNVLVTRAATGLPQSSVVNVTQLLAIDIASLEEFVGRMPDEVMSRIDRGLRLVLDL